MLLVQVVAVAEVSVIEEAADVAAGDLVAAEEIGLVTEGAGVAASETEMAEIDEEVEAGTEVAEIVTGEAEEALTEIEMTEDRGRIEHNLSHHLFCVINKGGIRKKKGPKKSKSKLIEWVKCA